MLMNRRASRSTSKPSSSSLSRAQFYNAVETYSGLRHPNNRLLLKSPSMSDEYSFYEHKARGPRHSNDVKFPPVGKTTLRPHSAPRCPTRRGMRKLPRMKDGTLENCHELLWYHEDGAINLEALTQLGQRRSFPRPHSSLQRLQAILSQSWPGPGSRSSAKTSSKLMKLLEEDAQLTPRSQAQRESFLAVLMNMEDLTDRELDDIARYFIPDEEEEEVSPTGVRKKRSGRGKKEGPEEILGTRSELDNSKPKSVHFHPESPPPLLLHEVEQSQRIDSSSTPRVEKCRPSDPFHVAPGEDSACTSDSPDEVAYLSDVGTPPNLPASPENIPEPKITYYDDDGEEIEEELQKEQNPVDDVKEDVNGSQPETPRSQNSAAGDRDESLPESESQTPEHMSETDTPRVKLVTATTQSSPRSQSPSASSSPDLRGMSDSLATPQSSPSPRPSSPAKTESEEPAPQKETPAQNPTETGNKPTLPSSKSNVEPVPQEKPIAPENSNASSPKWEILRRTGPEPSDQHKRPDTSLNKEQDVDQQTSTCQRQQKSSKQHRPKSARKSSSSIREGHSQPQVKHCQENLHTKDDSNNSSQPKRKVKEECGKHKEENSSKDQKQHSSKDVEAEEALPIPVISLTRGQLPAVSAHPPRVRRSESRQEASSPDERGAAAVPDSPPTEGSPSLAQRRRMKKDDRMKIWLTRTAWGRPVECGD